MLPKYRSCNFIVIWCWVVILHSNLIITDQQLYNSTASIRKSSHIGIPMLTVHHYFKAVQRTKTHFKPHSIDCGLQQNVASLPDASFPVRNSASPPISSHTKSHPDVCVCFFTVQRRRREESEPIRTAQGRVVSVLLWIRKIDHLIRHLHHSYFPMEKSCCSLTLL